MKETLWTCFKQKLKVIWDVMQPEPPELKAHLALLSTEQARLLRALHQLDSAATRDVMAATDSAAEF